MDSESAADTAAESVKRKREDLQSDEFEPQAKRAHHGEGAADVSVSDQSSSAAPDASNSTDTVSTGSELSSAGGAENGTQGEQSAGLSSSSAAENTGTQVSSDGVSSAQSREDDGKEHDKEHEHDRIRDRDRDRRDRERGSDRIREPDRDGRFGDRGRERGDGHREAGEFCKFFLRNDCKFGSRCRGYHNEAAREQLKVAREEYKHAQVLLVEPRDMCPHFVKGQKCLGFRVFIGRLTQARASSAIAVVCFTIGSKFESVTRRPGFRIDVSLLLFGFVVC